MSSSRTAAKEIKADDTVMAVLSEVRGVFTLKDRTLTSTEGFFSRCKNDQHSSSLLPACSGKRLIDSAGALRFITVGVATNLIGLLECDDSSDHKLQSLGEVRLERHVEMKRSLWKNKREQER